MAKYKVDYQGYFIVEADSADEALEMDRDDYEVECEEWTNCKVERIDE